MTDTNTPSIADRTRQIAAGSPVVAAHFLDDTAAFVLGEESVLFVPPEDDELRVAAHGGAILEAASAGDRIVTGGDDGKVVATSPDGKTETIAADAKHRWIDHVAVGLDGSVAWSVGKQAFVRTPKGEVKSVEVPSTPGALAFAPKGFRLAIAHYNGVSLWFPNAAAKPERLEWKGSHLGAGFSPDGKFLVTAMQEPTLHGWRLADAKNMRMAGYAARVRSLSWSAGGKWLATGGSNQLILWPFSGKDGPMGKQPKMLAATQARAETVACHPSQDVVAVGFTDGMILLVRIDDGAEVLAKRPGDAPVTAIAWSEDGGMLAWGTEDGAAGVMAL